MPALEIFMWGALGAVLPQVVHCHYLIVGGQVLPNVRTAYLMTTLVFCCCAGMFTVAWEPENAWKAIWVGVSFPMLLKTMFNTAPQIGRRFDDPDDEAIRGETARGAE